MTAGYTLLEWSQLLQGAGAIGQVVVAAVALRLAWGANKIARNAHIADVITGQLFSILDATRANEALYKTFLDAFASVEEKRARRNAWVCAQDELTERIRLLASLDSRLGGLHTQWLEVIAIEPDFVGNDSLVRVPDPNSELVAPPRAQSYDVFVETLAKAIGAIRS